MPAKKKKKSSNKAVKKEGFLEKSFLHKEQEQFYKDHPNAKMLIAWFMLLFVVLGVIYLKKFLMV